MTFSVTIDRTSLGLPTLIIADTAPGPYILSRGGLTLPARRARIQYATSANLHGAVPLRAVYDQAFIGVNLRIAAVSDAVLATAVADLEAALGQFSYTVTTSVPGSTSGWAADMASIEPEPLKLGEANRQMARFAISIPVYPIASA